jgi:serine/threonine protein kinase
MSLCINPQCPQPNNSDPQLFCQSCGSELLLAGRYKIMRLLSDKGGFGNTYEVSHNHQLKVLKVLTNSHPKALELFEKEAEVLSQLNHPGIPKGEGIFNYFPRNSQNPLYCLVMEKIEGMDLEEYQKQRQNRPIDQDLAVEWLLQITNILNEVHSHNFFHRDIKPSNIILQHDGQLALIDFGAVRQVTATILSGGQNTGIFTPGFAPPEQEKGYAVPQSDFYALGRTFVYLLTGKNPTDPDIYDRYNDSLNWRGYAPQIMPELADFIDYLMADKANKRPQNTTLILEQLRQLQTVIKPSSSLPTQAITPPPTIVTQNPQNPAFVPDQLAGAVVSRRKALKIVGLTAGGLLITVGLGQYVSNQVRSNFNNNNENNQDTKTKFDEGKTLTVSADGKGDYQRISDAIQNAQPHSIIMIKPGIYQETIIVNKPLEIIGDGEKEQVVIENKDLYCLAMKTDYAVVRNMTFHRQAGAKANDGYTIDISQGNLVLEDCVVTSESLACIGIYGAKTTPEIRYCIVNNSINDCGFYFYENAQGLVENCDVYGHKLSGFAISYGSDPKIKNCKIYNCQGNGIYAYEKAKGLIENCEIYNHTFHGIIIDTNALPSVTQCQIYNNSQVGVLCDKEGLGKIENCEIYQNTYSGVEIRENVDFILANCNINQNKQHGVYAHQNAKGTITNCDITGNVFTALNIDNTSQITQSGNKV